MLAMFNNKSRDLVIKFQQPSAVVGDRPNLVNCVMGARLLLRDDLQLPAVYLSKAKRDSA